MPVERLHYQDLPAPTRDAIETHTGPVLNAVTVDRGMNSAIAAVLTTESGKVFLKGLRTDYNRSFTQEREAAINPYIRGISPALLWRITGEWDLLGFDYVQGREADYRPGSADLPLLVTTMARLGETAAPDLPLRSADRWKTYVRDQADLELFSGDCLLHTDYNPDNVLIADGESLLIDWAWPTRGAGWIDPACLIIRLMACGHSADSAEQVVADLPLWQTAPKEAVRAFAYATDRLWAEVTAHSTESWTQNMAEAAKQWHDHRSTQ